ncbi:MAG: shikimate kinase [Planctomycetota bacterium]
MSETLPPPPSVLRLFLCGYRGTGKTSVARPLAARLGWDWVDTDDRIEQAAGKSIAAIFAEDGETAFRDLEERIVAETCGRDRLVVALGGGAVLREATRRRLREAGRVVGLTADAATLAQRITGDAATGARRPNLTAAGGLAEIEQVLAERQPIYQEVADLQLSTEGRPPEAIADAIAEWLANS